MNKRDKKDKKDEQKNEIKIHREKIFLIVIFLVIIGIIGAVAINYMISENSNLKTNKNKSNNNNNHGNSINTLNNSLIPKTGYSIMTIHGLKCYIKIEYLNFLLVTDDTKYEGLNGYFELVKDYSVDFVDYEDFVQLYTRDGNFRIEVSENFDPYYQIDSNETNNKLISDKNITLNGNKVRVIHFKEYSDQFAYKKEFTFVCFKINKKAVELAWAGDKIDKYVIESFFKLN